MTWYDLYDTMDPFYWYGLTWIPAWLINYIHYKVWDEITYPFPNFNGETLMDMWLLIHAGIKVNFC